MSIVCSCGILPTCVLHPKPDTTAPIEVVDSTTNDVRRASEGCAEALRSWLDDAEAGKLVSVNICGTHADGTGHMGFAGLASSAERVGQLELAKHDLMMAAYFDDSEDGE